MEKRVYTNASPKIGRLGFGAWPIGNRSHGKTMTKQEGVKLIRYAYQSGVNFFDTAPNYAKGKSEEILGQALKDVRDKVVINSKFGHHPDDFIDFNPDLICTSLKGSLKRLQTNYLDSLILHNPGRDILQGKTEHFNILKALKKEGLIKAYGVSVDTPEEIKMVLEQTDVDVIEILFNIFAQANRHYFDQLQEKNIKVIVKVPLDSGWLTGKYSDKSVFDDIRSRWTVADKKRRHKLIKKLEKIIGEPIKPQYAISYILSYDAVTTVIPGIRNIKQLESHLDARQFHFSEELKKAFEDFYDHEISEQPLPW